MTIGLVGLGKLGLRMARRLLRSDINVIGFDLNPGAVAAAVEAGADTATSIEDLVSSLDPPRTVWTMLPSGTAVDAAVSSLVPLLSPGDVVLDGGNSDYRETMRRATILAESGIDFIDVGTSGGIYGEEEGYCMMLGGDPSTIERLRPAFEALAPDASEGWGRVGPTGSGHFVKMVHNGIEYGMMQAFAEGLAILKAREDFDLDLAHVTRIWTRGSVVRSWLLDLIVKALKESADLAEIAPHVSDTGMGRWTVREAIDLNVAAPVITASLLQRIRSRDEVLFAERTLAAMRQQFGGHAVKPSGE